MAKSFSHIRSLSRHILLDRPANVLQLAECFGFRDDETVNFQRQFATCLWCWQHHRANNLQRLC